jgi:hypothetical protein
MDYGLMREDDVAKLELVSIAVVHIMATSKFQME